jgi:hypothetical protein
VKEQGSHALVFEYGAQRACFKAWVHWDRKGLNPITILSYSLHIPFISFLQSVNYFAFVRIVPGFVYRKA